MMELALVKTLLSREFYDEHKGVRCPERIFSKDVRKIKQALDDDELPSDEDMEEPGLPSPQKDKDKEDLNSMIKNVNCNE